VNTSVNFPYQFDGRGRTADAMQDYVRQLVEQVLFTSPGERVNRPNFGSGLLQAVFAPNSEELAATLNFLVQGALQQWLADLIVVEAVDVQSQDATVRVTVRYLIKRQNARKTAQFTRTV
jgi:phage baseplate assembly protein W